MKNRKNLILLIIGILAILIIVVGATYAYLNGIYGNTTTGNMSATTGSVDTLTFYAGDTLVIDANEENFGKNMGNIKKDTNINAHLIANNTTHEAHMSYNMFLVITKNDFVYTTDDKKPELLLRIYDEKGIEVTKIEGLVYHEKDEKNPNDVSGFDITTRKDSFLIESDIAIDTVDGEEIHNWKIEIELVNLASDQNKNTNKTFEGQIWMTKEKIPTYKTREITEVVAESTGYDKIEASVNVTEGTKEISKYYFAIKKEDEEKIRLSDLDYQETEDNYYEFDGLSANTKYLVYAYVEDEEGIESVEKTKEVVTDEYKEPIITSVTYEESCDKETLKCKITANVIGEVRDGKTLTYYYGINIPTEEQNNEERYVIDGSSHTYEGLEYTNEYEIEIYVKDDNEYKSSIHSEKRKTENYKLGQINKVKESHTWGSISIEIEEEQDGTNPIASHKYKLTDINGTTIEDWVTGGKSYSKNGLSESTEYIVYVKAVDSKGKEGEAYPVNITTDAYQVPEISVVTSKNASTINIEVTATPHDGSIKEYWYSMDNGSSWVKKAASTVNSNKHSFTGLTEGASKPIKVLVIDSNNRESLPYTATIVLDRLPVVSNVTVGNRTANSLTFNITGSKTDNDITGYSCTLKQGVAVVQGPIAASLINSLSATCTFNSLGLGTTYTVDVTATDRNNNVSLVKSVNGATISSGAEYIRSLYTTDGANNLYYHDGKGTYGTYEAGDYSYRYTGPAQNNYVCLDNQATGACTNEKLLFRIIGIFKNEDTKSADYGKYQIKLVRHGFASSDELGTNGTYEEFSDYYNADRYYWIDEDKFNNWRDSALNKVNLNTNYYNYLKKNVSGIENKIENHVWIVGGADADNIINAPNIKSAYDYELGTKKLKLGSDGCYTSAGVASKCVEADLTYQDEIGLMYVSDFGYSVVPEFWNQKMYSDEIQTNYGGRKGVFYPQSTYLWHDNREVYGSILSITAGREDNGSVIYQSSNDFWSYREIGIVKPTFYLNYDTPIKGTGVVNNPYRLVL